jgi:hypothetical protein
LLVYLINILAVAGSVNATIVIPIFIPIVTDPVVSTATTAIDRSSLDWSHFYKQLFFGLGFHDISPKMVVSF